MWLRRGPDGRSSLWRRSGATRLAVLAAGVLLAVIVWPQCASAEVVTNARIKLFTALTRLPSGDIRRVATGASLLRSELAVRAHAALTDEHWRAEGDVDFAAVLGDAVVGVPGAGDPAGANDGTRTFDLATATARGRKHFVSARIDRLLIGYRSEALAVSIGRQAVSWGNGLVFQPMDFFNPFAPAETDRDYKTGDDLLLVQRTLSDGGDVQFIAVGRRGDQGHTSVGTGSFGLRWQQPSAAGEFSLLVARHVHEPVLGLGWSLPVAGSVARVDVVATRVNAVGWRPSLVANLDASTTLAEHNVYGFAEVYRNGFGSADTPRAWSELTAPLQRRLRRGEVFTLSRWYGALGATVEWSPLWKQTGLLIASLQDGSVLAQSTLRFEPNDRQIIEFGVTWSGGDSGREFAGPPLTRRAAGDGVDSVPEPATLGGGLTGQVRLAWYW